MTHIYNGLHHWLGLRAYICIRQSRSLAKVVEVKYGTDFTFLGVGVGIWSLFGDSFKSFKASFFKAIRVSWGSTSPWEAYYQPVEQSCDIKTFMAIISRFGVQSPPFLARH